ncbi:MAG: phosphoadenosine phosphosulfate reductase family protein [Desulfurococcales archaeon]|nr:phosphoadenosine phosphosulfate reductase family protein [Desulfurococcales archaeon]
MYNIIVRSKRDADAVRSMIKLFYSRWGIKVYTLHGARKADDILKELNNIVKPDGYYIVLLGREEEDQVQKVEEKLPPNTVVHIVPRARVRNTRMEHLFYEFERARARQRTRIKYVPDRHVYIYGSRALGIELEENEPQPYTDFFLLRINEYMKQSIKVEPGLYLVKRGLGGEHVLYHGSHKAGIIRFYDDQLRMDTEIFLQPKPVNLKDIVQANKDYIELEEKIVLSILSKYKDFYDKVIIPWSGGKDSTTAAYLARKVFGKKVYAIYVDTGIDFDETRTFVEKTKTALGVNLIIKSIDLKKFIPTKGLPSISNRWCTRLKIKALEDIYKELCSRNECLIIVGDRDVESEARSRRPFERMLANSVNLPQIAPLKQWSTLTLQIYMAYRNIPVNPLYSYGFYRLGCYICPALRSWEIELINKMPRLKYIREKKLYREFLKTMFSP